MNIKITKKNILKILAVCLVILSIITLASYAYYKINLQGIKEHKIETNTLSFTYEEQTNELSVDQLNIMSDVEGKNQTNYFEFSVSSVISNDVMYAISLSQIMTDNNFNSSDIKIFLTSVINNTEISLVDPTLISDLNDNVKILGSKKIYNDSFIYDNTNNLQRHTYRLRVWIKDNINLNDYIKVTTTDNEQNFSMDKYVYKFKINVNTFDGKILTNLIANGSFEDGATNWGELDANVTIANTGISKIGNYAVRNKGGGAWSAAYLHPNRSNGIIGNVDHIYYVSSWTYSSSTGNGNCGSHYDIFYDNLDHWTYFGGSTKLNTWERSSTTFTVPNVTSPIIGMAFADYSGSDAAQDCYADGVLLIDLTEEFGAGNEPTKEWCDTNIDYFNGNKTYDFKPKTITNLITNGSFEDGINGWQNLSNSTFVSIPECANNGSFGLHLFPTDSSLPEGYIGSVDTIPYISGHVYYASMMFEGPDVVTQIYFPYTAPYPSSTYLSNNYSWIKNSIYVSSRSDISTFNSLIRLDVNNEGVFKDVCIDNLLLIDLTKEYGAGNEPTKEWCDANINYFDGTKTFDFTN